jgi:hypothetical protein
MPTCSASPRRSDANRSCPAAGCEQRRWRGRAHRCGHQARGFSDPIALLTAADCADLVAHLQKAEARRPRQEEQRARLSEKERRRLEKQRRKREARGLVRRVLKAFRKLSA